MARTRAADAAAAERLRARIEQLERRIADLERERAAGDGLSPASRLNDFARAFNGWFWETDAHYRFTYFSPSVEEITGVPAQWHYGKTREEIGIPDSINGEAWQAHLAILKRRESFRNFVFERLGPDGTRWMQTSGVPVFDPEGGFLGYRGVATDITAQVQAERRAEQLEELAALDDLTGLLNRRGFLDVARAERARVERYGHAASLLVVDVDHFKLINDRFGHAAGDGVLRRIAQACKATMRDADTVGRLGGEEFGILLPETNSVGAEFIAERLRRAVEALELGGPAGVTISVGIAEMSPGHGVERAIARADAALYRAKRGGRNRVVPAEAWSAERAGRRGAARTGEASRPAAGRRRRKAKPE